MKFTSYPNVFSVAFVASTVFAIPTCKRSTSDGYVKLDLSYLKYNMYELTFKIGTPEQSVSNAVFDTGSSDLIITENAFHYNDSSTFETNWDEFPFAYGSTDEFGVYLASDTFAEDNWKLNDFTIGVTDDVTTLDDFDAVLGVSYITTSAFDPYNNFPLSLQNQSLAKTNIFSLYGETSNPSVVFGGVHQGVYVPPLYKTPIGFQIGHKATLSYYSVIAVTVNSVKLKTSRNEYTISNQNLIYSLDTGNNGLVTTQPIYDNLVSSFKHTKTIDNTTYFKYSDLFKSTMTFDITGFDITFPLTDIIDETKIIDGQKYASLQVYIVSIGDDYNFQGYVPNCIFKYVYTVFDLENNQVLFAPYSNLAKYKTNHIAAIENADNYPVATATKKEYTNTYTAVYTDTSEVTLTAKTLQTHHRATRRTPLDIFSRIRRNYRHPI